MACLLCGSEYQSLFSAELALSFPGLKSMLMNPPLCTVLKALVCLDCGFGDLRVTHAELKQHRQCHASLESRLSSPTARLRPAAS